MSQEYTPVDWVDETTSQQGTLINAARLNQMQTAHHYADGFEEVDAIPTEDPGVDYHKVVYCTADTTFYRWDGTQWTADIDEDTKHLLDQEIARATQAEGELAQDIEDEATARASADTALGARIDEEAQFREDADRQIATQIGALNGQVIPLNSGSSTPTIQNAIAANEGNISNLTSVVEGLEATKADSDNVVNSINGLKGTVALYPANIPMGPGQATLQQRLDVDLDLINANTDAIDQEISDRAAAIAALQTSKADTTALTDGSVTKIGTADVGSNLRPIKLVGGVPTAVTNDLVSTSGAQTVGGTKTFTSSPVIKNANVPSSSAIPASHIQTRIVFNANDDSRLMTLEDWCYSGGPSSINLSNGVTRNGKTPTPTVNLTVSETGVGFIQALNQRDYNAANVNDIATIKTLDAYSPMVRTSGNQAIGAEKTFNRISYFPIAQFSKTFSGTATNCVKIFSANMHTFEGIDFKINIIRASYINAKLIIGGNLNSISCVCESPTGLTDNIIIGHNTDAATMDVYLKCIPNQPINGWIENAIQYSQGYMLMSDFTTVQGGAEVAISSLSYDQIITSTAWS